MRGCFQKQDMALCSRQSKEAAAAIRQTVPRWWDQGSKWKRSQCRLRVDRGNGIWYRILSPHPPSNLQSMLNPDLQLITKTWKIWKIKLQLLEETAKATTQSVSVSWKEANHQRLETGITSRSQMWASNTAKCLWRSRGISEGVPPESVPKMFKP